MYCLFPYCLLSLQDIIEFLFFPVVNEGCRVVAEGIVDKAADLDVATVMAMGFPPYRWVFWGVLCVVRLGFTLGFFLLRFWGVCVSVGTRQQT